MKQPWFKGCIALLSVSGLVLGSALSGSAQFFPLPGNRPTNPNRPTNQRPNPDRPRPNPLPWPTFPQNNPDRRPNPPRRQEDPRVRLDQEDAATQVWEIETYQTKQFQDYFDDDLNRRPATAAQVSATLARMAAQTGKRPAAIYVATLPNRLDTVLVLPNANPNASFNRLPPPRVASRQIPNLADSFAQGRDRSWLLRQSQRTANTQQLAALSQQFRNQISDPRNLSNTGYLSNAQQLYQWLVAPLEPTLQANQIDTLVFVMDDGLRSLPVAALHDGKQFVIERYSVAIVPSFGLTDTRAVPLRNGQVLGVGISEPQRDLSPLPAVAVEVPTLTGQLWPGRALLNQDSTLDNLETLTRQQQFQILHLATHAVFNPGKADDSYIQLWNQRLKLGNLGKIAENGRWSPTLDLLVLSACQTALGNSQAELGFTGMAVRSGVETSVGSLWRVSDTGSLGLMLNFYQQLKITPTRAEALRQAQLALLRGQVRQQSNQLLLGNQTLSLPPNMGVAGTDNFSHPYYWAAFQMVGNWN